VNAPGQSPGAASFWRFVKFCFVGGGGVVVDMGVFYLLHDAKHLAMTYQWAKVWAAETALVNNFVWNELWTFRDTAAAAQRRLPLVFQRLVKFHLICGAGILWAVGLLSLFHGGLGINVYVANLLAILVVTVWNYWLNARFNWRTKPQP
jgi:dolichol-phosphate mannosyltransferase